MSAHFFVLYAVSLQQYGGTKIVFPITGRIHHGPAIIGWKAEGYKLSVSLLFSLWTGEK